jgi:hypothetical protein
MVTPMTDPIASVSMCLSNFVLVAAGGAAAAERPSLPAIHKSVGLIMRGGIHSTCSRLTSRRHRRLGANVTLMNSDAYSVRSRGVAKIWKIRRLNKKHASVALC